MTDTDKVYLGLLQDILDNGVEKDTRAGRVKSVFGRQLRFNLKKGFPLLTTKKVFTKGVIYELLWFLQRPCNSHGSMNIEYLVRNGVHIWDDDAYRWFKSEIVKNFTSIDGNRIEYMVCVNDDEQGVKPYYEYWMWNQLRKNDSEWLRNLSKEDFLDLVLQRVEIWGPFMSKYRFGDLGPVYGKQWRKFGGSGIDQINNIITTLKTSPNDRRMLCLAFNPDDLCEMALPPCHVMMQFYTRELAITERMEIFKERSKQGLIPQKYFEYVNNNKASSVSDADACYDMADIPRYGLSCMWTQRSVDVPLGLCWNISSYALLTHMIAKLTNMAPDELVGSLGDCHIYMNQIDGVNEHLSRKGYDVLPKLIIEGDQKVIEDFKYENFKIFGYMCDPVIKIPLSVG